MWNYHENTETYVSIRGATYVVRKAAADVAPSVEPLPMLDLALSAASNTAKALTILGLQDPARQYRGRESNPHVLADSGF